MAKLISKTSALVLALAGLVAGAAFSQTGIDAPKPPTLEADIQTIAIQQTLAQRYPNTKFSSIKRSNAAGLWEVTMGANTAYVTDDVRYFVFGHLFDMQTQTDLTASNRPSVPSPTAPKFSELELGNAIKTVQGNGTRKLAVFSDVDCPYCQSLELALAKLKDVTIYTFFFPLTSIHPKAAEKSAAIWCAPDRQAAWLRFLKNGAVPSKSPACATPLVVNAQFAAKAGIQGTPYILFADDTAAAGSLDLAALEQRLTSKN